MATDSPYHDSGGLLFIHLVNKDWKMVLVAADSPYLGTKHKTMTEIKISLEAVEALKKEIKDKTDKIARLEKELHSLDPDKLKSDAAKGSKIMFSCYMNAVFKELGFDDKFDGPVDFGDVSHWLGEKWYQEANRLDIIISTSISNKWREAFIRFGVKDD